jgi:hypothetical protein
VDIAKITRVGGDHIKITSLPTTLVYYTLVHLILLKYILLLSSFHKT